MKVISPAWWASNEDSSKDSIDVILETQMERRKSDLTRNLEVKDSKTHMPKDKTVMVIPMTSKPRKAGTSSGNVKQSDKNPHKKAAHRNAQRLGSQSIQPTSPTYLKVESKLKSLLDRDKKEHAKANKIK